MFKYGLPVFMYDADGGNQGGTTEGKVEDVKVIDVTDEKDTKKDELTLEQVQKMIQSETDKVRGEYSKRLKDKEKELEDIRLESMSEDDRKAELLKKTTSDLEQKEAQLLLKELTLETIDLLKTNNLPLEARDFLIGKDVESTKINIEQFKNMFASAIELAVTERFKSTGKEHVEGGHSKGRFTQSDVAKMSAEEINLNWEKIQRDLS